MCGLCGLCAGTCAAGTCAAARGRAALCGCAVCGRRVEGTGVGKGVGAAVGRGLGANVATMTNSHDVLFSLAYFPSGHCVQNRMPVPTCTLSPQQRLHCCAPCASMCRPRLHPSQRGDERLAAALPGWHRLHFVLPWRAANCPGLHETHVGCPRIGWKNPLEHRLHRLKPALEKYPGRQDEQT